MYKLQLEYIITQSNIKITPSNLTSSKEGIDVEIITRLVILIKELWLPEEDTFD